MSNHTHSALTINKILVPTDFSEISIHALEYAALIAREANAEIILLHVFESYSQNTMLDMVIDFPDIVEKGIRDKIDEIKKGNAKLNGVTVHPRVVTGKIHNEIENITREEGVKLIVMGTYGVSGVTNIGKFFIGSNAYRTIQEAPCPIITLREKPWKDSIKDIVVPIDSTKESEEKLDIVISWAKFFGSTVHVLAVTAFFEEFYVDVKAVDRKVHEVEKRLSAEGINYTAHIARHQAPSFSVLEHARKVGGDLIIMVTGQEWQLTEMLLGSSARNIVTESTIPVLSINIRK
ncbi:MAG: universal stress protein [Chitinophagales bacterium]|jgi:nucleotide-binding universal stress UspA family protein|nr:universal stress protein [Chitinophagales bacterium]